MWRFEGLHLVHSEVGKTQFRDGAGTMPRVEKGEEVVDLLSSVAEHGGGNGAPPVGLAFVPNGGALRFNERASNFNQTSRKRCRANDLRGLRSLVLRGMRRFDAQVLGHPCVIKGTSPLFGVSLDDPEAMSYGNA